MRPAPALAIPLGPPLMRWLMMLIVVLGLGAGTGPLPPPGFGYGPAAPAERLTEGTPALALALADRALALPQKDDGPDGAPGWAGRPSPEAVAQATPRVLPARLDAGLARRGDPRPRAPPAPMMTA